MSQQDLLKNQGHEEFHRVASSEELLASSKFDPGVSYIYAWSPQGLSSYHPLRAAPALRSVNQAVNVGDVHFDIRLHLGIDLINGELCDDLGLTEPSPRQLLPITSTLPCCCSCHHAFACANFYRFFEN